MVAADEREGGRRAILNYGHTLAHALETAGGHDLRHGEAVAIGLVYAADARPSGSAASTTPRVAEHRAGRRRLRPAARRRPPAPTPDELVALMGRDKKALDGLTFALDGPGGVEVVAGVPEADVRAALSELLG